jgi:hypothetical protein
VNRPGLSAIAYRAGTHSTFFEAMVAGLSRADRPQIAKLATRDRDDFSIALLDAFATVADVLTFYSERLAQESYLRTARDRTSLQELGRLLGYRPRPGVAAETRLAFAIEAAPAASPGATLDPGGAPPVTPDDVTLPEALRVQSIPGPGEQPQTFETVEELEARPAWNALPAATTTPFHARLGDTRAWLEDIDLNLRAGDVLALVGTDVLGERWDVRVLTRVTPDGNAGRTEVEWAEGLGSVSPHVEPADPASAFVLRRRIPVFGHNAPIWTTMPSAFRRGYPGGPGGADWPDFILSPAGAADVDLDGPQPDVVAGSWIVLSRPSYRELWQVEEATELSRAAFGISGKVTRLKLTGGENYDKFDDHVRDTTVYALSEPLTLAETPDASLVSGDEIAVRGDTAGLGPGRSLLVRGVTSAGKERVEAAVLDSVQGSRLILADSLVADYRRETVVVYANVALATHGESVHELLGSGRADLPFQRFALAQEPLTHRQSADPSGAEPALEVRVNDVRWERRATLFDSLPDDHAYAVGVDERARTYLEFGDGERGARLPTGSNNVRALYRKGLGAAGNVRAGALAQLLDRPLGAKGVSNPDAAAGGVDPEGPELMRASIPLAVRTLGRAVSRLDYEDFARAFAGVSKAHAAVLPLRGGETIVVTVALEGSADRLADLSTALRTHGDPHVQVTVLPYHEATFRLALKVTIDPAYDRDTVLAGVTQALRAAFAFEARAFTQPVHRSEVVSVVHGVSGVVAVDLDRLYTGTPPGLADRLLAQQPGVTAQGDARPAGVLVLDPAPFDYLDALS